jgi:hypothetical protein
MSKFIIGLILFFGSALPAQSNVEVRKLGALGAFENLNLMSCKDLICIKVTAAKGVQGSLAPIISFKNAKIDLRNKDHITESFSANGYYDMASEKIFFTDVYKSKFKEAYYDKLSGKFTKL